AAAFETAVDDVAVGRGGAGALHRRGELRVAARAAVAADVELRQLTLEKPRDHRADGVAVIEDDALVLRLQTRDLRRDGGVIGLEIGLAARGDLLGPELGGGAGERLAGRGAG